MMSEPKIEQPELGPPLGLGHGGPAFPRWARGDAGVGAPGRAYRRAPRRHPGTDGTLVGQPGPTGGTLDGSMQASDPARGASAAAHPGTAGG